MRVAGHSIGQCCFQVSLFRFSSCAVEACVCMPILSSARIRAFQLFVLEEVRCAVLTYKHFAFPPSRLHVAVR